MLSSLIKEHQAKQAAKRVVQGVYYYYYLFIQVFIHSTCNSIYFNVAFCVVSELLTVFQQSNNKNWLYRIVCFNSKFLNADKIHGSLPLLQLVFNLFISDILFSKVVGKTINIDIFYGIMTRQNVLQNSLIIRSL